MLTDPQKKYKYDNGTYDDGSGQTDADDVDGANMFNMFFGGVCGGAWPSGARWWKRVCSAVFRRGPAWYCGGQRKGALFLKAHRTLCALTDKRLVCDLRPVCGVHRARCVRGASSNRAHLHVPHEVGCAHSPTTLATSVRHFRHGIGQRWVQIGA